MKASDRAEARPVLRALVHTRSPGLPADKALGVADWLPFRSAATIPETVPASY